MLRMGRRRQTNKHLPLRVYWKNGAYRHLSKDGKWTTLGKTESEMFQSMARLSVKAPTIADQIERYKRECMGHLAANTRQNYTYALVKLAGFYGHMQPSQVKPSMIAKHLDEHPSPSRANFEIAVLSTLFKKMMRWDVAQSNPCMGVERNKIQPRKDYVTDARFWGIWKDAKPHIQLLMELCYILGQDPCDIVTLKLSDVTPDGILFKRSKTARKTGKELLVSSDKLEDIVSRCKRLNKVGSMWLLANAKGQPYTMDAIRNAWQKLMKGREDRFRFQDIRAKSATDHPTGKHLGHSDERTLKRFYRLKPEAVEGL